MTEDPNVSTSNERSERPFSGWQPASERRSSGGDRGDRRYGERDGYRGGKRYEDRGGYSDRRDDRHADAPRGRRDPIVPDSVSEKDLDAESRRRLTTLSKENSERVARHLVYAGSMLDVDPELSYEHAQAAYRRASRVDVVREALGLAAYMTGRYSEALRELRTYRRMTDDYSHVAIEADSERGLGRSEKALAFISEIPLSRLDAESKIELALVASGAKADTGDSEGGLAVIEKLAVENFEEDLRARVELIRADRLEELGREEEAKELRASWESVLSDEGEVDLYEEESDDADASYNGGSDDSGYGDEADVRYGDKPDDADASYNGGSDDSGYGDEADVRYGDKPDDAENDELRYDAESDGVQYVAEADDSQYAAEADDGRYEAETDGDPFDRDCGKAQNGGESDESEETKDSEAGRNSEPGVVLEAGDGPDVREDSEVRKDSEAGGEREAEKVPEAAENPGTERRSAAGGSPDGEHFETIESREDKERPENEIDSEGGDVR